MSKRKVTPRQAMSARQVDKLERELVACVKLAEKCRGAYLFQDTMDRLIPRLTRLLASVRRSEVR